MADHDDFRATTEVKIVSKVKSTIYTKKQHETLDKVENIRTTFRRRRIQGQSSSRSKSVDLDNITYASTYTTETSNGVAMTRTLVYLSHDEVAGAQQTSTYLGPVITDGRLIPSTISSVQVALSPTPSATMIPKPQAASNNSWQVPVIVVASVIFFILPFGLGLFLWSCCAKKRRERERAELPISRPLSPPEIKQNPISRPVTPRPPMSPREPVSSTRTNVPFYVPKLKYLNGPRIEDFPAPPVPPKPPGHIKIPAKARRTTSSLYSRSTLFFTQGYSPARLSKHTDRTPSPDPTSPTSIRAPFRLIRPRSLPASMLSPNHSPSGSKSSSKSRMDSVIDPELNVVADGLKVVESTKGSRRSCRMTLNSPTIPRDISGSSASSSTASRETVDWASEARSSNQDMMIPIVLERRDTHCTLDAVLEEMWADEHHQ